MSNQFGARKLVNEIKNKPESLSAWEVEFIHSIETMLAADKIVSYRQGRVLQKIYRRIYGGF